jgi:hypothetical protein
MAGTTSVPDRAGVRVVVRLHNRSASNFVHMPIADKSDLRECFNHNGSQPFQGCSASHFPVGTY